jgi:hypothetical protein
MAASFLLLPGSMMACATADSQLEGPVSPEYLVVLNLLTILSIG